MSNKFFYTIALFLVFGISVSFSQENTITIEAEDFLSASPDVTVQENASASNGKIVGYFKGSKSVMYSFKVDKPGTYNLSIFASNFKKEESAVGLTVNGDSLDVVKIAVTGDWNVFAENKVSEVKLKAGKNTIKLTQKVSLSSKLDKLVLTPIEK